MYAKKSLGQHFVRCEWVISTLVKSAGVSRGDAILEIGPGTGALTRALAKNADRVIAVEKDERMAEELKKFLKKMSVNNVAVATGDILKYVPDSVWNMCQTESGTYKIVANIPYYLTSRLLRVIFEKWPRPEAIVLTIQKEVAQRIVAKPPKMNLLAFSVQFFGKPEIIKTVPAECFYPKPKVESAIIKITPHKDVLSTEKREKIFKVAKTLFSSPRKTVLNNLSRLLGKGGARDALDKTGIPQNKRAGELSINDIAGLAGYVPD